MFGVDDLSGSLQLIFWIALLPTFYVAYRYESLALASTRHKLNEWLVSRLSMFDFADNPQLIQQFNLADELHSATRIGRCRLVNSHLSDIRCSQVESCFAHELCGTGKYAQYLASQNQFVEAVAMFNKALAVDPNHPGNLLDEFCPRIPRQSGSDDNVRF